jgi:hypothetical protein
MMKKLTCSVFFLVAFLAAGMLSAQVNEQSPMFSKSVNPVKGLWDVLFSFNTAAPGEQAVETDGTYLYTAMWQTSGMIRKYNTAGVIQDSFTIAGVAAGIRDLCYDGTHFYGRAGATGTSIYKMDFNSKTLVSTISLGGTTVRHLCYDPTLDGGNGGFWAGDWATLSSHKKDGSLIASITPPTGFASNYGSTWDNTTAGGPYIWFFNQDATAPKVDLVQYQIATNTIVSTHDASNIPGIDMTGALAGGLGGSTTLVAGKFVLIANVQQDPNLIAVLDLGSIGINTPASAGQLKLYPNPATTILNLNADYQINQLTVFNAVGQVVESTVVNSMNHALNTSAYKPGVYFVQINSEKGTSTRKFVVSE